MEFKNIENPKKLVYCHFCEREITRITYFLNDESKKEICVSCFMKGRESESHKKTDPYRIIERLDKDFLENEWSCYDELSFLEAIELYGYGNWSDISTHLPSKTSRQIERHFKYCYYQHLNTETGFDARKKIEEEEMTEFKPLIDKKNEQLAKMIEITTKESIKNNIGSGKTNIYGDIIGFMPLRKEFDYEYDNDAEQLLAEMEFTEEDSENDRKIKFSVLEIYNRKLKEREKRKEFVIERNKLDIKAIFEDEKTKSEEEKAVRNALKVYERFLTEEEFEELVECYSKERKFQSNIDKLMLLKQAGYTNLKELENLVYSDDNAKKAIDKIKSDDSTFFNQKKRRTNTIYPDTSKKDGNKPVSDVFDITNMTEEENIKFEEQFLCSKYEIPYQHFLIIKEYLIRESINQGFIDKEAVRENLNIKGETLDVVFESLKNREVILEKNSN